MFGTPETIKTNVASVGESLDHLREAFSKATECFRHVFWMYVHSSSIPTK